MPTYELFLTLATSTKRVNGRVTLGFSRLPIALLLNQIHLGHRWKDMHENYPQVNHEEYVCIKRLYNDLIERKLIKKLGEEE